MTGAQDTAPGSGLAAAERSSATPTPVRLFVALWPGPHVRQALADCRDLAPPAGSRRWRRRNCT